MMRAAVFRGVGAPLSVEAREDPMPGPGEVVVEVACCGICGSDLYATEAGPMLLPEGTVLGHEFAGIIRHSRHPDWQTDDHAAAIPLVPCDRCRDAGECREGKGMACPRSRIIGLSADLPGGYAEHVVVPGQLLIRLPRELPLHRAALIEPFAVAAQAIAAAGELAGKDAIVMGAGPIGLAVVLSARRAGSRHVLVSEPAAARREMAQAMGATATLDPSVGPIRRSARELLGGNAATVVFECSGVASVLQDCIDCAAVRGTIVVVGVSLREATIKPFNALSKRLTLRFVLGYDRADFETALRLVCEEGARVDRLITQTVGFDALPAAFEALRRPGGQIKVMIQPSTSLTDS